MSTPVNVLRPSILIIDDDPQSRRYLRQKISSAGYHPYNTGSGILALEMIDLNPPDAIILDLQLRDIDSRDVIARSRKKFKGPIVVLSAFSREIEEIDALDLGADAIIVKPFDVLEVLARLRVAFRRRMVSSGIRPVFEAQSLSIDLINRTVSRYGVIIELTELQYSVLASLAVAAGRVLSYEELANDFRTLRRARLAIWQLRKKLEKYPHTPAIIVTEPRIGYRLSTEGFSGPAVR